MKANSGNKYFSFYSTVLYVLAFLLFLEWLYPVEQITDTDGLGVFIVFAGVCFVVSLLQLPWWLSFGLKGAALILVVDYLFMQSSLLTSAWFSQLLHEISYNSQALSSQAWYDLTPMFRSFLFLILIWLMSYLLYYWFVAMQRIFLFVLLTIVYVAIMDAFTAYDASNSIVRVVIFALLAFGFAGVLNVTRRESIPFPRANRLRFWLLPLNGIVIIALLIGMAAPKFSPVWPDPVPFLQGMSNGNGHGGGGGRVHKVGYGEDDTTLGGSFEQDDTPVFQATEKKKHYWRIETKDVYTGKGWKNGKRQQYVEQSHDALNLDTFSDHVKTDTQKTTVEFQGNTAIKKLVYPYGVRKAKTDADLLLAPDSGAILTQKGGKEASLKRYTLTFASPSFAIDALQHAQGKDPRTIKKQYTQLPNHLPKRIDKLAKDITAGESSRYDKAKAIVDYFRRHGYTYQTKGVPVPKGDEDYVDQFLFDTKEGYCDNYSTSMVVLLRTLGIPARWAKGFTGGKPIPGENDGAYNTYEVTNSNAHSWPEVYFPGTGWVPFEPTQGFSNLSGFHENNNQSSDTDDKKEKADDDDTDDSADDQAKKDKDEEKQTDSASKEQDDKTVKTGKANLNWWLIGALILIIIGLGVLAYLLRFRLMIIYLSRRWRHQPNQHMFQKAYHLTLKLLAHKGLPIQKGETLRVYAERVDTAYQTTEMQRLTHFYEQVLYREHVDKQRTDEFINDWEQLVKQIMA